MKTPLDPYTHPRLPQQNFWNDHFQPQFPTIPLPPRHQDNNLLSIKFC